MTDRYAVVGNPVAHSKSPLIHAEFARQTGQDIDYGRLLAPLDGFRATVEAFRSDGGRGLNVTVPFKLEAFELAERHSERALDAAAVNTLKFESQGIFGDNTDGAGLVRTLDLSAGRPLRRDYHMIVCRNVLIYFDRPMQERLFQLFTDCLSPGGYLILGKVESLVGPVRDRLQLVDARERVYRRPA